MADLLISLGASVINCNIWLIGVAAILQDNQKPLMYAL